ncbi:fibronectin type III domain-containing protein, partial [Candidatus Nitrosotalea sp. FS]|uniref:fibronectin type III domain-containing protein n=1 Tax=Candidatus Nitrosotalea sp. FS TaxID=2341021 RepID=UPI0037435CA0
MAPNPPQNLVASIYSSTQINLSWNTPTSNGGPSVTGYKIDYMLDSGVFTNIIANSGSTLTTYSHTGLQTGHTYTYRVFAINSIGTGNASSTASAVPTQVITVPGSPTLNATPLSSTSINLSWMPPSSDGGSAINGYKIEYANGTSTYTVLVANTGNTQTSYIHSGLSTGKSYTYRITAINSIGAGNPSNAVTTQPQDTKTPTIVSAVAISPTSVMISWIQPSQTYGQMVSGYTVDQVISGNFLPIDTTSSGVTSYTIPNLTTNKTYTFSVTAMLSGGSQTNPSPTVSVMPTRTSSAPNSGQTPSQPPTPQQNQALPDPPSGTNATLISSSTVKISWIAPSNNGKLPITGFKIESKTGVSGTWSTVASNTGVQMSFIKSGLESGTTYYYRVSSINNVGTSQPSNEVLVTTQQITNPTPIPPPPPVIQHSQGMIPVFNTTSTIAYEITGGRILGIGVNPGTFSLNINLKNDNPGTISVTIPRDMVDAKKRDGTDDTFIVTSNGMISEFNETKTGSYRMLSISFPANTDKISIYGTTAVPE